MQNSSSTKQASTNLQQLAQNHLLPKGLGEGVRLGSASNELDWQKRAYIIKMRQSLAAENSKHIVFDDGSLNFKYFNVKKGHYWSHEESERLLQGVLRFGATDFKSIKKECFRGANWSETEIRLRVCRLLKCYDLSEYEGRHFASREELLECAKANKEEALRNPKKCVGGILYPNNTKDDDDGTFLGCKFQKKAEAK